MNVQVVFLVSALVVSATYAKHVGSVGEVNPTLEEVIYEANQDAIKNHREVIAIPAWTYDRLGAIVRIAGGQVSNFSTLALRGEDQFLNQTDGEGLSVLYYSMNVGLDQLTAEFEYDYSFIHFFHGKGVMQVSVNKNAVRASGAITSRDDGTCDAVLESAVVTELGDIEVSFTPSGITKSLLKLIVQFVGNHIVPRFIGSINEILSDIVKNEVPKSDFSKIVCKPFSF